MNNNLKLLSTMYSLFNNRYPSFLYSIEEIQLWTLSQHEYVDAYLEAAKALGIKNKFDIPHLQNVSGSFCGELLKTDNAAIILLNEDLIELGDETNRIILHELAHAFSYKANINSTYRVTDIGNGVSPKLKSQLGYYGWQMWDEYLSEYITQSILHNLKPKSPEYFLKEYLSLMHNPANFSRRMGFFLSEYRLIDQNCSDFFIHYLRVKKTEKNSADLINAFQEIDCLVKRKLSEPFFWIWDESFLSNLGQQLLSFGVCYLAHHKLTDEFLHNS